MLFFILFLFFKEKVFVEKIFSVEENFKRYLLLKPSAIPTCLFCQTHLNLLVPLILMLEQSRDHFLFANYQLQQCKQKNQGVEIEFFYHFERLTEAHPNYHIKEIQLYCEQIPVSNRCQRTNQWQRFLWKSHDFDDLQGPIWIFQLYFWMKRS